MGFSIGILMPKKAFEVMRNLTILRNSSFAFIVGISSIILLDKGLDYFTLGLWISFYSLFVVLFEVPTGAFADAYGRKKAIMLGFATYVLFLFFLLLGHNTLILTVAAFFGALAISLLSGSMEAHVVDILSERGKTGFTHKVLSSGLSWQHFTFLIGSVLGGYIATFSIDYAILLCMGFTVIGFFYSWLSLSEKRVEKDFVGAERKILANMSNALKHSLKNNELRTIFVLSLLFGLAAFGLFNYWQPVMREIAGWDTFMMGLFFSLISIMVIIGSRISPHLKADWNTIILIYIGFSIFLFIAGLVAIPIIIVVSLLLWDIVHGMYGPIGGTIINRNTSSEIRATVLSLGALSTRLGMVLFGFLIFFIGADEPRVFWMVGAGFLLLGALYVLFMKPKEQK